MTFENYKILFFIWVLPALVLLFVVAERKRAKILFAFFGDKLKLQLAHYTIWGRRLQFLFFLLAFLLFLIALMQPLNGVQTIEVERKGVDLYFLVDVSPSMLAQDVAPSRIERTRYKILDFLQILKGDRVGLVAFSGEAFVLTPLTADYETFATFVNELNPDLFPVPGTNIKDAVEKAVESFAKLSQTSEKAIVLFSDGEDSTGLSNIVVEQIQKLGVQIYVLGVGTDAGAPVPNSTGGYKTDHDGKTVLAKLDEAALKNLSLATGGGYVRLTFGDADLRQIYEQGIQKAFTQQKFAQEKKQLPNYQFQIFIALGLLAFLLDLLVGHKKIFVWRKNKNKYFLVLALCLLSARAQAKNPFVFDQANEHFDAGEYAQALEDLKALENANPQDPEVAYNLGNTYYKLQQYTKAQEAYLKALNARDVQTRRNSLYNLGNNAFRQNQLEDAIKYYEQSLAIDPAFEMAQSNLDYVKKMLEQQQQEDEKNNEQKKQDEQKPDDQKKQEQDESKQNEQEKNDQGDQQDQQEQKNQESEGDKQDSQQNEQDSQTEKSDSEKQDAQNQQEQKLDNAEQKSDEQQQNANNQTQEGQNQNATQQQEATVDPKKIEGWLKAMDDDPSKAIEHMIQKKSSSSPKKFDKDW